MSEDDLYPVPSRVDGETVGASRLLPVLAARPDACPRERRHLVVVRADGAMWCRGCDEAFYPAAMIWALVTSLGEG